jgi:small subunit ribosomal protein S1
MTANSHPPEEQKTPFSMEDFSQALTQEEYDYRFNKGDIVKGKVFTYDSDGALVDIGGKSPGFISSKEASWGSNEEIQDILPLDQEFDFMIISEQNPEGQVKLSRRQLFIEQAWDNIAEIEEKNKVIPMVVTGFNRGGVTGEVEGLRAFIPRSHLIEKENLEGLVNQTLSANILEAKRSENKLVLSQRNLARASAIAQLQEQELSTGKVVKFQPYGIFVDLGGVTGLLHIKQISQGRVESLENLFSIGEEIKVVVMEVDEYKNRISLSTKILETYPGELIDKKELVMETAAERLAHYKAEKAQTKENKS